MGFPGGLAGKESACNSGNLGSIPGYPLQLSWASLVAQLVKNPPAMQETWVPSLGWEDSPGEGNGYLLQYSDLENSVDCIVHGVTKSWTQLSKFHFHFLSKKYHVLEDELYGLHTSAGCGKILKNIFPLISYLKKINYLRKKPCKHFFKTVVLTAYQTLLL